MDSMVSNHTTYFLVDDLNKHENMNKKTIMCEYTYEKNSKTKRYTNYPVNVYCAAVIEKEVTVEHGTCSIVHYLCTKMGYDGYGYASNLLTNTFSSDHIRDQPCYVVSSLAPCYGVKKHTFPNRELIDESHMLRVQRREGLVRSFYNENEILLNSEYLLSSYLLFRAAKLQYTMGYHFVNKMKK